MVSIIIPCFNGYKYMARCITALEKQTKKEFEIVIVDDASTDGSYNALVKYRDNSPLRVKIIRNESNQGPGKSREIGVKNSTGDQIAFCDCDDWYEENFIERMTELLREGNADLVLCDSYRVRGNRKRQANATKKIFENNSKEDILAYAPMSLCRTLIKKELIEKVDFFDLYYGEDGVVLLQLIAKASKITVTKEVLYNYLLRETSASSRPSARAYQDGIAGYEYIRKILGKEYPESCEFIGIKNIIYAATLGAFKAGVPIKEIKKMTEDFYSKHPRYMQNRYLDGWSKAKRIYIQCIYKRRYFFCKGLAFIHKMYV